MPSGDTPYSTKPSRAPSPSNRSRLDGAIQNMYDLIEQSVADPRAADFRARLTAPRTRCADPVQEIVLVRHRLSSSG